VLKPKKVVKMEAQTHRCIECKEVITNPICPRCLGSEIKVWLKEKMPELVHIIGAGPRFGSTRCIFCKKEMGICAHCFSRDIYLEVVRLQPDLGEDFISCFNYDLREEFE
jgi:hypothetical protein